MNLDDTLAEFLELYPNVSNNQPACTLHAFKCWYWATKVNIREENNKNIVKEKRETIEEEQEKNKK